MRRSLAIKMFVAVFAFPYMALADTDDGASGDRWDGHDVQMTRGVVDDDLFAAGGTVDIDAEVEGDVFAAGGVLDVLGRVGDGLIAAGGEINSSASVADDAIMAGGTVTVDGPVGDNLVVFGGRISIDSTVDGKLVASGFRVRVGRQAQIVDDVMIAAGQATLAGRVGGNARIVAGDALILGEIGGNVVAEAQQVEIGPGARIGGTLTVTSPNPPRIDDSAVIVGAVKHIEMEDMSEGKAGYIAMALLVPGLYLILLAALLELIAPGFVRRSADRLMDRPFAALGVGVLGFAATPAILLLLVIIVIGIPFALIGGAAYVAALMFALPFVALLAAHWFLRRREPARDVGRWPVIGLAAVALVVLFLAGLVPFLGGLVWLGALCLGIGAATMGVWQMTHPQTSV